MSGSFLPTASRSWGQYEVCRRSTEYIAFIVKSIDYMNITAITVYKIQKSMLPKYQLCARMSGFSVPAFPFFDPTPCTFLTSDGCTVLLPLPVVIQYSGLA